MHIDPDTSGAITDLEAHPPHVVVAMATAEFGSRVMPSVEDTWGESMSPSEGLERPYYVLSHLIYNTVELPDTVKSHAAIAPPLSERVLGVNYALAQDDHSKALYQAYLGRLQNSYQGQLSLGGTENYYDGAYSLLYAIAAAAANRVSPTGNDIRDGLQDRVLSTSNSADSIDVGPAFIGDAVGQLNGSATYKMSLWGTMGEPNFDRSSGTRVTATSAWCIQLSTAGTSYAYQPDGLIYDPATRSFQDSAAGVPACLSAY